MIDVQPRRYGFKIVNLSEVYFTTLFLESLKE